VGCRRWVAQALMCAVALASSGNSGIHTATQGRCARLAAAVSSRVCHSGRGLAIGSSSSSSRRSPPLQQGREPHSPQAAAAALQPTAGMLPWFAHPCLPCRTAPAAGRPEQLQRRVRYRPAAGAPRADQVWPGRRLQGERQGTAAASRALGGVLRGCARRCMARACALALLTCTPTPPPRRAARSLMARTTSWTPTTRARGPSTACWTRGSRRPPRAPRPLARSRCARACLGV
jgi:hypothetical protein